jgi:hypothetical protein
MKKEFNQKMFSEFKESVVSTRQRIINVMASSNMVMCQTLTENAANNFLKECIDNNISVELNVGSHESIENFMDYIAHLYHAKGLALEDTDEPTINDMIKYHHICQCDAIIYQNDEATEEELFNDFGVVPLDMLDDEKLKEYRILFEAFEKYVAYYDGKDKSGLLYDLFKQKRKQSIKVDDNIRQIMHALIGWRDVDEEDITHDGNLIFFNNYDQKSVEFCGKDGEYYHFITGGYYGWDDEYEESDYFVKIENEVAYTYEDGVVDSLIICLNKTENDNFYIKNGTKNIHDFAFKDCNFDNVIVPDSVYSISKDNFFPSNIKKITLKSKRINIYDEEDEYFRKIINFEKSELESLIKEDGSLVIPNNITEIPDYAFRGCRSLTSVEIPDSVIIIGKGAFKDCSSLTSVVIPNSVTSINFSTFENCISLKSIIIPNSVIKIESHAFYGCSSLESIIIPDSVTSMDERAFYDCSSLTNVVIGNGVKSIDFYVFKNCISLTNVMIGSSVQNIGCSAFEDCASLTSIVIPNNVTNIDFFAFQNCKSLTSVVLPDNITNIDEDVFYGCDLLEHNFNK